MKIAVNKCYGGFGLSPLAIKEYLKLKGKECFFYKKNYDTKMLNRVSTDQADTFDISLTKDYGKSIKDAMAENRVNKLIGKWPVEK